MEVHYDDKRLEKLCSDEREMRRRRADIEKKLRLRVNALKTSSTLGALPEHDPLGYWHELTADRPGIWAGKVSDNQRLLVRPEGDTEAKDATTVTIIDIVDYH